MARKKRKPATKKKKGKRKLTAKEKAAKKARQREYMTIFVHGKQKRVKRPPTIDGMDVDEFIRRNADPIWLHQEELWDLMEPQGEEGFAEFRSAGEDDSLEPGELPF